MPMEWVAVRVPPGTAITYVILHLQSNYATQMSDFSVYIGDSAGEMAWPLAVLCGRGSYSEYPPFDYVRMESCGGQLGPWHAERMGGAGSVAAHGRSR